MLICKILLRNSIHEVTNIITYDCRDNYSGIKQSRCAQKRKIYVELERLHLQRFLSHIYHLLNVSLKTKTDNMSITIRCTTTDVSLKTKTDNMSITIRCTTTEERVRGVDVLLQGAGIRQVSHFFRECLQIPISCWQMSQLRQIK